MAETLESLHDELKTRTHAIEDLHQLRLAEGGRSYTTEEKEKISTLESEADELAKDIERVQEDLRIDAAAEARIAKLRQPQAMHIPRMDPQKSASTRDIYPRENGFGKNKAFSNDREGNEAAYRSGKWLQAQFLGDHQAKRWCDRNGVEHRIMVEGVISKGGALVPDELSQRIIALREEYGLIRRYAYVEPMASDTKNIARQTEGLTPYFVGEKTAITASDSTWDVISLVANKLAILTRMSSELDEDAVISMADRFAVDAAHAFAKKEDQCGLNGDGTATYGGITGIRIKLLDFDGAGTDSSGVATTATTDLFSEITMGDLETVLGLCPEYALMGDPAWYCSQMCYAMVFTRLAAALGGSTMVEDAARGLGPSFLGYPIRLSPIMPTTTGAQNLSMMLLFGDMSLACTLGDRRGITLARSEDKYFDTDEIALKATERFDFVHHNPGDATTPGPLVGFKGAT